MMNFHSTPDSNAVTQRIVSLSGLAIKSVALVCCETLDEVFQTVNAYISPNEISPKFRHAVEMEQSYCRALLRFDEIPPPAYGGATGIDLFWLAGQLGVARVYCVVVMSVDGAVSGCRNYDEVEVTVLESIDQQISRFEEMLEDAAGVASPVGWLQ